MSNDEDLHREYLERGRAAYERQDRTRPHFIPPDYVDTLALTHLLELPRDLNLPQTGLLISEPRDDVFVGYPPEVVSTIVDAPESREGMLPSTRLLFGRTHVRGCMPLQAADLCFGHWTRAFHADEEWEERTRQLEVAQKVGIEVPVTVVTATRFVVPEEWGVTRATQEAVLARELDAALDVVNDFIVSLGLTLNQPRLAPINRGDLPWLCPVIVEGVPMSQGVRVGATFVYAINEVGFGLHPGQEVKPELVEHAAELTKLAVLQGRALLSLPRAHAPLPGRRLDPPSRRSDHYSRNSD